VPNVLGTAFPNLHYIWLTRRDTVAQAVSHWKAIQTGIWHVAGHEDQVPATEPKYDFQAIHHLAREVESHNAAWQRYFADNGIQPFDVVYEDLVEGYEATVYQLLAFLGVSKREVNVGKPRTTKQIDAVSDEWVQRYLRTVHR
jgi:trehalose 2-sulfotransferase